MSEKKMDRTSDAASDHSQSGLKKAMIAFAIIEALVFVPLILYLIFR